MKSRIVPLLALAFGAITASAQTDGSSSPQPIVVRTTSSIATITLGDPMLTVATVTPDGLPTSSTLLPLPPTPPFTFVRGTHLQLVMPTDGVANPQVTWYKDGNVLGEGGGTWDIPTVSAADSGWYSAKLHDGATVIRGSDTVRVQITASGAPLVNYSTRAVISPAQPFILGGFVVQPGPAQAMVLVRAVGPALAQFGVANALAAPRLQVMDASGTEIVPFGNGTVIVVDASGNTVPLASRAGEFPLPPGGKDVERVYLLSPGAYTAKVSSADAGSGTVLLEVYQLPL